MTFVIPPARGAAVVAITSAALLGVAACGGGSNPVSQPGPGGGTAGATGTAAGGSIRVGSADFSESVLLAELYAGALQAKGINAATSLNIGAREAYLKGLADGSINVIPEYTGALALYYKKDFAETDPQKVYDQLKTLLPAELTVLEKSAAEDKDSITVAKGTADKYKLTTISSLAPVAKDLVLGGQPEFATRKQGVPGLTDTYNVTFKEYRALRGQALIQALKNGQVDAANIFTTDPAIQANSFVVLQDDKNLFGAQNVVPLITKQAATPQVAAALNGVSAKLTTDNLRSMLAKTDLERQDPKTVAADWLKSNGLG